jgi:hypothetical protein
MIRASRRLLAVSAVMLLAACGMGDLLRFTAGLIREFGSASVNITNQHLTVTLRQPPAGSETAEGAAKQARRVAEYVRDRYPGYPRLEDVTVEFQTRQQYGPVGFTRGQGSWTFTHAELGSPRPQR